PAVTSTLPRRGAATTESFVIEGGHALSGRVKTAGNKNGALPILAACLLAEETISLTNVPRIRDVETMLAILRSLGADADWTGPNEVVVTAGGQLGSEVDEDL